MAEESLTTVTPNNNGPYLVQGNFKIVMPSGKELEVQGGKAYLCRCGGSSRKPFCDGTHKRIGFQASEQLEAASV